MNEQRTAVSPDRFFAASLADADPAIAAAIGAELRAPAGRHRADRQREHRLRRRARGAGQRADQQICRGLSRPALLRRLCRGVDVAEQLAIDRAKQLFDCAFANVQPHSGAQANQAVLLALLKPGDTILGMSLAAGGHLTHGAAPNLSGKWFNAVQYGVRREDGLLDYEELERLAREHRPKLIIAGASAYPRAIDFARIRRVADEVGAVFHGRHGALSPGWSRPGSTRARCRTRMS